MFVVEILDGLPTHQNPSSEYLSITSLSICIDMAIYSPVMEVEDRPFVSILEICIS